MDGKGASTNNDVDDDGGPPFFFCFFFCSSFFFFSCVAAMPVVVGCVVGDGRALFPDGPNPDPDPGRRREGQRGVSSTVPRARRGQHAAPVVPSLSSSAAAPAGTSGDGMVLLLLLLLLRCFFPFLEQGHKQERTERHLGGQRPDLPPC